MSIPRLRVPFSNTVDNPDRTPDRQNNLVACFPSVCFPMDPLASLFTSRKNLPLLEYASEFSQLTVLTAFDGAALNSLFWFGANYHRPFDLPDTTGLSWREAIIRCLESVLPRSRAQPDTEPSPPSPRCAKPEPADDGEPETAATNEPSPYEATEQDRRGAEAASDFRPGARAGFNTRHKGKSCGQRDRREELRPLHHG